MLSSLHCASIYDCALVDEIERSKVAYESIKQATQNLIEAYKPSESAFSKNDSPHYVDYNDAAHRCAYLHKYAPFHTRMVQEMLSRALNEGDDIIKITLLNNMPNLNVCSLGGGPGIDILGALSALHKEFGLFHCSSQIIELMEGWADVFDSVLEEVQDGYGNMSLGFSPDYFQSSFIIADLLGKMSSTVNKAIGSANLITMVKFLSSVTCKNTGRMVRKIFNSMKHGALLLFIDNDGGGYRQLVSRLSGECRLQSVFGFKHVYYTDKVFDFKRYGYKGCFKTCVTVQLLMKPYISAKSVEFPIYNTNDYERDDYKYCDGDYDDEDCEYCNGDYNKEDNEYDDEDQVNDEFDCDEEDLDFDKEESDYDDEDQVNDKFDYDEEDLDFDKEESDYDDEVHVNDEFDYDEEDLDIDEEELDYDEEDLDIDEEESDYDEEDSANDDGYCDYDEENCEHYEEECDNEEEDSNNDEEYTDNDVGNSDIDEEDSDNDEEDSDNEVEDSDDDVEVSDTDEKDWEEDSNIDEEDLDNDEEDYDYDEDDYDYDEENSNYDDEENTNNIEKNYCCSSSDTDNDRTEEFYKIEEYYLKRLRLQK